MKLYRNILKRHAGMMALFVALGIACAFLSAWSASLLQTILDSFTAQTLRLPVILLYGTVLVVLCLLNYAVNLPESRLSNGLYMDFKLEALRKMETIDYRSYVTLGTGALVQRIENGASAGRNIVFDFWLRMLSELLPEVLSSLLFIALIDLKVTVWLGAGYVVVFLVSNLLLKALYRIKERILIDEEAFSGRLIRGFMEMVVFRVNRRYGKELRRAEASRDRIVTDKTRMQLVHECFFTVFAVLVSLIKLGFLLYAYFAKALTVGEFVALTVLVDKAYQPIAIFNVLYVQYRLDRMALRRYEEILTAPDDPRLSKGHDIEVTAGHISIDGVTCAYGEREVLKNVSLEIPAGSVIGIAGESGAGKSTLVKLIMGLLSPASGTVSIDGTSLADVHLPAYYRYLSYTPQEPPVFDGTLRENIVFDADISDEEIFRALDDACLTELVRRLPRGLDTPIGEKGAQLSGGERQRLAFARIFLQKQSRIFILDEATSALDTVTEEKIMRTLLRNLRGHTILLIAHRLTTLRPADRIFLFRSGSLLTSGPFDHLAQTSPYFAELLDASSR